MSMIELTHGGVITRGSGSMDIFVSYRDVPKSEDLPLHIAVKDPNSGVKEPSGIIETFRSSSGPAAKSWTKRRIEFPDGSFVRFTIRNTLGAGAGAFRQGLHNFVISPRTTAPLQEIRIAIPTDERSNVSAVYITGRFDIMTPKEIKERRLNHGNNGANDMSTYDFAALDELMSLRIMEKGTRGRTKTKVLTSKVTGKGIVRIRRARRIILPGG